MSDIDLQTASMVIRDAVAVCRKFRMRYLWLDALCIIQDGSQDWQRESAVMGKIFRNAYFTKCVVQEKTLARRLLLFGATSIRAEFGSKITIFQRLGEETPVSYSFWRGVTECYSACLLTFDKDRLQAISGVARFFAEATGDQYLAGMWRRDLWSSLFWKKQPLKHDSLSALVDSQESP
ncbi:hypothetical protein B0T26DRAFT_637662, partial [Lasiosphaeria miniovina]